MARNILLDELPDRVAIGDGEYEIYADFRVGILFELMLRDDGIPREQKMGLALDLFYPEGPPDVEAAYAGILWFVSCGKREPGALGETEDGPPAADRETAADGVPRSAPRPGPPMRSRAQLYDFDEDAERIYAAFWQAYRIDLQALPVYHEDPVRGLHWWKFMALLGKLPDCDFTQAVHWRTATVPDKASREMRARMERMIRSYALPDKRTEEEKEEDLADALMK